MWCGAYVVSDDFLAQELSEDILLGISAYTDREDIEGDNASNQHDDKNYHNNVEFIIKNTALWQRIDVRDKAKKFFDYENTHSVRYKGFLVNHTKKQALDMDDYYKNSLSMTRKEDLYVIDPIPALTETGGGLERALFEGMISATTENLDMEWCGDLLQIVNDLPNGYERIDCCFAEIWGRARFCQRTYGVDEEDFLLEQGKRFVCCKLNLFGKRSLDSFMKIKLSDNIVNFSALPIVQAEDVGQAL
jgi:hypothetical protein